MTSETAVGGVTEAALALANKIRDLEQTLKNQLKSEHPDEKAVSTFRSALRDKYEKLIFMDYKHACSLQCEKNMWRYVFHQRIEEFRKKIARASSSTTDPSRKERAELALRALNESFARFISKSKDFYRSLLVRFLSASGIFLPGYSDDSVVYRAADAQGSGVDMVESCQTCLIYLGDLDRYLQVYTDEHEADWNALVRHYRTASLLVPRIGNPHNQMAVICWTFTKDEISAVYHYARAICCAVPFMTARSNLQMLLEKNEEKNVGRGPHSTSCFSDPVERRRRVAEFGLRFVRLHGILFTGTDLDDYMSFETDVLIEMMSLLDSGDIDSDLLLKMAVILIFSATNTAQSMDDAAEKEKNILNSLAKCRSLAVGLCFRFFCKVSVLARSCSQYLAALSVLTSWLMHDLKVMTYSLTDDIEGSHCLEMSRQSFVQHLVDLLNLSVCETPSITDYHPLKEDVDLMGFLPLAYAHRDLQRMAPRGVLVGRQGVVVVDDVNAGRLVRLGRLHMFAQRLATGSHPLLFYDSQSGDYSVEGQMPHCSGDGALGVHSQQRLWNGAASQNSLDSACGKQHQNGMTNGHSVGEDGELQERKGGAGGPPSRAQENVDTNGGGERYAHFDGMQGHTANQKAQHTALLAEQEDSMGNDADADNEETFGDSQMDLGGAGDDNGDFSELAKQAVSFATNDTGVDSAALVVRNSHHGMPEAEEDVTDMYLEQLVSKAIGTAAHTHSGEDEQCRIQNPALPDSGVDEDDNEEIILFKPTGSATLQRFSDSPAVPPGFTAFPHCHQRGYSGGSSGENLQSNLGVGTPSFGIGMSGVEPSSMWGMFGKADGQVNQTTSNISSSSQWLYHEPIPVAGAQAALHYGSLAVEGALWGGQAKEGDSGRGGRFSTNNPFV